jgi:hypothetical protein
MVNNSDLGQNYIPRSGAKRGIASDSQQMLADASWPEISGRGFCKEGADGPPFFAQVFLKKCNHSRLAGCREKMRDIQNGHASRIW